MGVKPKGAAVEAQADMSAPTAPSDMERVFPMWDQAAVDADFKAAVGACAPPCHTRSPVCDPSTFTHYTGKKGSPQAEICELRMW